MFVWAESMLLMGLTSHFTAHAPNIYTLLAPICRVKIVSVWTQRMLFICSFLHLIA